MSFRCVLACVVLALSAGTAVAQSSLGLKTTAPLGWTEMVATPRRAVYRKELGKNESCTLRVGIAAAATPTDDAAAFIAKLQRPGETVVDGSAAEAGMKDLQGRRVIYQNAPNAPEREWREIAVAPVEKGVFLVVRSEISFKGDRPSPEAQRAAEAARAALVRGLVIAKDAGPASAPANLRKSVIENGRVYEDTTVLPFSFVYPGEWYISDDSTRFPGTLFVLLAPDLPSIDAEQTPAAQLPVVMRVQVSAHVPELQGAADATDRLRMLVKETLAERTKGKINVKDRAGFLIGAADAGLIEYALPKDDRPAREGFLVYAAVGTTIITADFSYPVEWAGEWKPFALEILNSFKVGGDAVVDHCRVEGMTFDCPLAWGMARVKTSDGSIAVAMRAADQTETLVRSIALPAGAKIDAARFDTLVRAFLSDEMKLLDAKGLADGLDIHVRGAARARRWTIAESDRATDIFGLVRGGAVHFGFVTTPAGVAGPAYGRAIDTVFSLAGEAPIDVPGPLAGALESHFRETVTFGTASIEAYDLDGKIKPETRGRLTLRPDGSATLRFQDSNGVVEKQGTYAADGKSCRLTFTDGLAMQAQIDVDAEKITTPAMATLTPRTWFLLPYAY